MYAEGPELQVNGTRRRLNADSDRRLLSVARARGFGIAGVFEKGGYGDTCAEMAVDKASGAVRIVRAVEAFECGAVVNPDLRNPIEGSIAMGVGGALFEAVEFDNGRILNARFSKYRIPRFADMPKIEVALVDRKDLPSAGAGETPIVGIAPAVANAIHDAACARARCRGGESWRSRQPNAG